MGNKLIGAVVTECLKKFPNTSTLCLARIIYRDNVALFTNIEAARAAIRYYRGAIGNSNRQSLKNKDYVRKFTRTEIE
jgi:hypothetical protein